MTHHSIDPSSSQGTHNSMPKLIIASDAGSAKRALQPGTPLLLQGCMCQEGDGTFVLITNILSKVVIICRGSFGGPP